MDSTIRFYTIVLYVRMLCMFGILLSCIDSIIDNIMEKRCKFKPVRNLVKQNRQVYAK